MADLANTAISGAEDNPSQTKEPGVGSMAENNNTVSTEEKGQEDEQSTAEAEPSGNTTDTKECAEEQSRNEVAEPSKAAESTDKKAGEGDGPGGGSKEPEGPENGQCSSPTDPSSSGLNMGAMGGAEKEGAAAGKGGSEPEERISCSSAGKTVGNEHSKDVDGGAREETVAKEGSPVTEEETVVKEKPESNAGGKDAGSPEPNVAESSEKQEVTTVNSNTKMEAVGDKSSKQEEENELLPDQQSSAQQHQSSSQDKKRSVTVDDPEDLKELSAKSGEQKAEDEPTSLQLRSRSLGPDDEPASKPFPEGAQPTTVWYDNEEESPGTVSYSTTIVGGVAHKMPIQSSPKSQQKTPKNTGQQSQGILRNLSSFFGKRKKSKTGTAPSPEPKASETGTPASGDKGGAESGNEDAKETATADEKLCAHTGEPGPEGEVCKADSSPPQGEGEQAEKPSEVEIAGEGRVAPTEAESAESAPTAEIATADQTSAEPGEVHVGGGEGVPETPQAPAVPSDAEEGMAAAETSAATAGSDGERKADQVAAEADGTETSGGQEPGREHSEDEKKEEETQGQPEQISDEQEREQVAGEPGRESSEDEKKEEGTQETQKQPAQVDEIAETEGETRTEAQQQQQQQQKQQQETTRSQLDEKGEGAAKEQAQQSPPDRNGEHETKSQEEKNGGEAEPKQTLTLPNGAPHATNGEVESPTSSPEPTEPAAAPLVEPVVRRSPAGSHSPKNQRMQMRLSYAERSPQGGLEVELISSPERVVSKPKAGGKNKSTGDLRVSCRELGEVDHEGWLFKKGGSMLFASWKRKWVVLKDAHLYYYKTSFDPEAGGVIPLNGCVVGAAPDGKRKFCFMCEQPGVKAGKSFFAAENKDDMDRWLEVLGLASRGEPVVKTTPPPALLTADQGASSMRKKSNSVSKKKRSESVLGLGGRFDGFLEDQEDSARSRTSVVGSVNKNGRSDDTDANPEGAQPEDKRQAQGVAAGSDKSPGAETLVVVSQSTDVRTERARDSTDGAATTPALLQQPEQSPPGDAVSAKPVDGVGAVSVSPESTAPVQTSCSASPSDDQGAPQEAAVSIVIAAAQKAEPQAEDAHESKAEMAEATDEHDTAQGPQAPQPSGHAPPTEPAPREQQSGGIRSKDNSNINTSTAASVSSCPAEKGQPSGQTSTEKAGPVPKAAIIPRVSSAATTWYCLLDSEHDTWALPDGNPEEEHKAAARKSNPDEDQLMALCKTVNASRLSIVGYPLLDGPDRLRAMSSANKEKPESQKILRLCALERSLKDKEREITSCDELLSKEVDRQSIVDWAHEHPDLSVDVENLQPQQQGTGEETQGTGDKQHGTEVKTRETEDVERTEEQRETGEERQESDKREAGDERRGIEVKTRETGDEEREQRGSEELQRETGEERRESDQLEAGSEQQENEQEREAGEVSQGSEEEKQETGNEKRLCEEAGETGEELDTHL